MDYTPGKFNYVEPKISNKDHESNEKSLPPTPKKKKSSLKQIGQNFCQATSLHGLKYIGDANIPIYERITWILILTLFLVFGAFVMQPIYHKWQVVPTITTVETTNYPIWNIHFPAVTICSNNKVVMTQFNRIFLGDHWKNMSNSDPYFKDDLLLALTLTLSNDNEKDTFENESQRERVKEVIERYKDHMTSLIKAVMPSCSDMLIYCEWQGKAVDCKDLFGVRNTDNGYCCSFNTLKMAERFIKTDYNLGNSSTLNFDYDEIDPGTILPGCPYPNWYANGNCDAMNNIPSCNFDGGDCCIEEAQNENCGDCVCVTESNFTGCPFAYAGFLGDGICHDVLNIPSCNFDEGDCCLGTNSSLQSCKLCQCLNETTTSCPYPFLQGDGFCFDIVNNPECSYDGGDCCNPSSSKYYCMDCQCLDPNAKMSTPDNFTKNTSDEPTKLHKTNVANSRLGLTLLLHPDATNYHSSAENNYVGFKVLVHSPYDFAEVVGKGFTVGARKESFIAVGAQYTKSSDEVQAMPLEKRKCLSHSESLKDHPEIILEAFQNYSRKACLLECQANDIFKTCGCLPYFFAEFGKIWKVNTACNLDGLECLTQISDSKSALQTEGQEDGDGYISNALACNCPNDCDETLYFQEISDTSIKKNPNFFRKLKNKPDNVLGRLIQEAKVAPYPHVKRSIQKRIDDILSTSSIVHVYFKELGIVKYSRDQIYTAMDVIAAFGGVVGLCIGFSLVSAVEILYWFSVRLYNFNGEMKKNTKNKMKKRVKY